MITRGLTKLIFYLVSNGVALLAAARFVDGFKLTQEPVEFLKIAAVLTLLNLLVRPLLKLVLGPFLLLTLGLGVIAINMALLYSLTIFSSEIKIAGLLPLLYATLIVGLINVILHFLGKGLWKKED